jgi:hypothetical protein
MAADPVDAFVNAYVDTLQDQNAAVFAGAGLSIPAGFVDWKALLRDIAKDVGLDVDQEHDLITVAQYHLNEHGRHRINQALIDEFSSRASLTDNHRILASLPIRTFWTTNYDGLIEQALQAAGKTADVKITPENLATTKHRRDAVVYKMHGDATQPHEAIITKEDYELFGSKRALFSTALQGDLVSKTFLFLGFSFNDPNLGYVLGRIRSLLGHNARTHYSLVKRVRRSEFDGVKQFRYAEVKQELQIRDLKRYGIHALVVDDYSDYTEVLRRISRRYRRSRVFISGSADDYGPWTAESARRLIREMARQLASNGFGIVSGFGLGVGPEVINGVLDQLDREKTRAVEDRLILRPFPLGIANAAERKRRWTQYREQIIDEAGIAIFLFGNKRNHAGAVVQADGVQEEFDIAVAKDVAVVPVGCTGSVSGVLHKTVVKDFESYFPTRGFKGLFSQLAEKSSAAVVTARVVRLVTKLRDQA